MNMENNFTVLFGDEATPPAHPIEQQECDVCGDNVIHLFDNQCRRCVIQFGLSCRINRDV